MKKQTKKDELLEACKAALEFLRAMHTPDLDYRYDTRLEGKLSKAITNAEKRK